MKSFVWIIFITIGSLVTIVSWASYGPAVGMPALLGFVGACWALATFLDWLLGMRRHVVSHLQTQRSAIRFISKDVGASRRVDYVRVLESIAAQQQNATMLGMERALSLKALKTTNIMRGGINWESVESEDGNIINIPENAVYFLHYNQIPFVASLSNVESNFVEFEHEAALTTGKGRELELAVGGTDCLVRANEILQWLRSQTSQHSIYRGKMLLIASPQDGSTGQTIRITRRPEQSDDRIIIPPSISQLVQRLVDSRLKHRDALVRYGHNAKIGLLFHGAPGTGKTLFIRSLISRCEDHTIIAPTDMAVETLREAFRLAQYLQPSIMVLEDVDLLAQQRESSRSLDGLQELMNQLDGLTSVSETIILMSTNRPEVLEPALASRPGRISQAIEFPLPDSEAREQLFGLFLQDTKLSFDIAAWNARTDGASPAFIEELCKRAILLAIEERDEGGTLEIHDEHLDRAIHELVFFGGTLTASSLGFPNSAKS